jgi:phospholipid/cholesterol/gamma-HCH transport system substrate-binding protein
MMTTRIRIQLMIFAVIAATGVAYLGGSYVGVAQMVGLRGYEVTVLMPQTGGLFTNGEVTYRGVPVGRIGDMEATPDGVEVQVRITDESVKIPTTLDAVVRNRSAIGEQYLDLRPTGNSARFLSQGDRFTVSSDGLPLPLDELLTNAVAFNESVPTDELRIVVDEFYLASLQSGKDLASLLETSTSFAIDAADNLDTTINLIQLAEPVLETQVDISTDIRAVASDLRTIADALASSDQSVRQIIASTPGAAREFQRLMEEVGRPLSVLLGNLLTVNGVVAGRANELDDVLFHAPRAVQAFDNALGPDGLSMGLTTNFTDPMPCTRGYRQGLRKGTETKDVPLLLANGCAGGLPRGAN